jgi:hypothetical protein
MAIIPASQARAQFTQALVSVYKERPKTTSFLRSFFPSVYKPTRYVSIEVQRGFEKVAVDVLRGTEGNRNEFGISTQKVFDPPFFKEYFDMTQLDMYDVLVGQENISADQYGELLAQSSEKLGMLQDKIERAYEVMCSQALTTGIITTNSGDNIDFKRKAASLDDLSATPWTGANNPYTDIEAGCNFIRQKGKAQGGTFNMILGADALQALLTNSFFLQRQNLFNMALDTVRAPQRDSVGATLHGQLTAGSYKVNLWAYPEYYDNTSGVSTPYINSKKVIIVPEAPKFTFAFAAVPRLITTGGSQNVPGAYHVNEFMDERKATHDIEISSAGIPIPVAIDTIYTAQVVA